MLHIVSSVLCDKNVSPRHKVKFYKVVAKPTLLCRVLADHKLTRLEIASIGNEGVEMNVCAYYVR